jgi:hypothetical protein
MGQPVVHFEVLGKDGPKLRSYYSDLFGWQFDTHQGGGPSDYGTVPRDGNTLPDGTGIPGGVGTAPEGYEGHVIFYVSVPDVEAALAKSENLGGKRIMGPHEVPEEGIVIGQLEDPDGHVIGVVDLNPGA